MKKAFLLKVLLNIMLIMGIIFICKFHIDTINFSLNFYRIARGLFVTKCSTLIKQNVPKLIAVTAKITFLLNRVISSKVRTLKLANAL